MSSTAEIEIKLKIPSSVYQTIAQTIVGSSYSSVEDYIMSLILETTDASSAYSETDEKEVRERLAKLGYE